MRNYKVTCLMLGKPWAQVFPAPTSEDALKSFWLNAPRYAVDGEVHVTDCGPVDIGTITGYGRSIAINGASTAIPYGALAYKYADPTEGARWVYDEADLADIRRADPSFLVEIE